MSASRRRYERIGRNVVRLRRLAAERPARGQRLAETQDHLNRLSTQVRSAVTQNRDAMWLLHDAETQYRRSDLYLQEQGLGGLRFAGFDQRLTDEHVDQMEVAAIPEQRVRRETEMAEEVCLYS